MPVKRSRCSYIVFGVLALGTSVRADMGPPFSGESGTSQLACACVANPGRQVDSSNSLDSLDLAGLCSLPVNSLLKPDARVRQAGEIPPALIQSDEQNSLGLCLYTLLGLGAFRSISLAKRLPFSHIPQWYYDGRSLQVGHSGAISPACLCHASVYCHARRDFKARDIMPSYRWVMVLALWRKSQFTAAVLASRGPPAIPK